MKTIKLTNDNLQVLIDDEDFEKVNALKWFLKKGRRTSYACSTVIPHIRMHRFILGTSNGDIDHKDGNGLNNKKNNLRFVNHFENARNTAVYRNNKVGFRGVHFAKDRPRIKPYRAMIQLNKRQKSLGYYDTAEKAAKAFDKAAKQYYGNFCGKLNFE